MMQRLGAKTVRIKEQVINEAIPAARKVQKSGKARFVGITGLPVRYLHHVASQVEVGTILSWAHYDLVEDEMDDVLTPLARERGIGLINASPLHQRLLQWRLLIVQARRYTAKSSQ